MLNLSGHIAQDDELTRGLAPSDFYLEEGEYEWIGEDERNYPSVADVDVMLLGVTEVDLGVFGVDEGDGGTAVRILHPDVNEGTTADHVDQIGVGGVFGDAGEENGPPGPSSNVLEVALVGRELVLVAVAASPVQRL